MARELTDEEERVRTAAYEAWPRMIIPDDEEMRDVCDSLVTLRDLNEVREGEGEPDLEVDPIVGYLASPQLHERMQQQAALN